MATDEIAVELKNDPSEVPRESVEASTGGNTGRNATVRRDTIALPSEGQGSASGSQRMFQCRERSQESGDDDDEVDIIYITGETEETIMDCADTENDTPLENSSSRKLLDVVFISGRDKGEIGVRNLRKCKLAGLEEKKKKLLIRVFRNVIVKYAKALLPLDPMPLIAKSLTVKVPSARVENNLEELLRICPKGTQ